MLVLWPWDAFLVKKMIPIRIIYYASRQLIHVERNYTTTEREVLGIVYVV